jgi:hypothetical protein
VRIRANTVNIGTPTPSPLQGPESPMAGPGPTSVPPAAGLPHSPGTPPRRQARGSRRAPAPGPPGTPPNFEGGGTKTKKLRNDREYGELRGGHRMANGRALGLEKGSAWTMARAGTTEPAPVGPAGDVGPIKPPGGTKNPSTLVVETPRVTYTWRSLPVRMIRRSTGTARRHGHGATARASALSKRWRL